MAIRYKYIERPKSAEDATKIIENALLPLLSEAWNRKGKAYYNSEFAFNIEAFVTMWFAVSLVFAIAYEDDTPVGVFLGVRFTPFMFNRVVVQTETCYGKTPEIEQGLYAYICDLMGVLGASELWVATDNNEAKLPSEWKRLGSSSVERWSK